MKNIILYCGICVTFFSCKKDTGETKNILFDEVYPSSYFSAEWHYNTPYVRMFTKRGEVKNAGIIDEYLARTGLWYSFKYQNVRGDGSTGQMYLTSKDHIDYYISGQDVYLSTAYQLIDDNADHTIRHFRALSITSSQPDRRYLLQLRRAISLHKWEYEILPDLSLEYYKFQPEIYSYKTDSNILVIPHITFQCNRYPVSEAETFPNEFDISGCQILSDTDTLLIQESSLIFKRQW